VLRTEGDSLTLETNYVRRPLKSSSITTAALPISNKFAVFGMMARYTDARSSSLIDSGEDLIYAAGISWNLSERWGNQLSHEELELDIRSNKLGAMFRFSAEAVA
jgi:hypothetical protein